MYELRFVSLSGTTNNKGFFDVMGFGSGASTKGRQVDWTPGETACRSGVCSQTSCPSGNSIAHLHSVRWQQCSFPPLFVDCSSMSRAIVVLAERVKFHRFDGCYTCPYRDEQFQERTVKELAESATEGCPVCFVHHYTVIQGIADITPDDKVFRDHANPFAALTVETPNARIQWRNLTFFAQSSTILRKSTIRDCFCPPATAGHFLHYPSIDRFSSSHRILPILCINH